MSLVIFSRLTENVADARPALNTALERDLTMYLPEVSDTWPSWRTGSRIGFRGDETSIRNC